MQAGQVGERSNTILILLDADPELRPEVIEADEVPQHRGVGDAGCARAW